MLVGAVVPLTLSTIGQDRNSFIQDTHAMANADASVAQPRFVLVANAAAPRHISFGQRDRAGQLRPARDGQGGAAGR